MGRKIEGKLFAKPSFRTNEYHWTVYGDGYGGHRRVHEIKEGDHLIVFRLDGTVHFSGYIKKDTEIASIPRPNHPELPQQFALGCWVYWIQEGWNPDEWALLFFQEYRAELLIQDSKPES